MRFTVNLLRRLPLVSSCVIAVYGLAVVAQAVKAVSVEKRLDQKERTFFKYLTRPDIDAPVFHVDVHHPNLLAPGHWFVAPYGSLGQDSPGEQWVGPHIYDGTGELVWSGAPMFGYWNAFDTESRVIKGERMLTLLSDHDQHGFILESSYNVYQKVPFMLEHDEKSDMHEFNVFEDGKRALYLTHTKERMSQDVSKAVGFDGSCLARQQGFREVVLDGPDAREVIFDWDANDHIGLDETTFKKYDGSIEQQCSRGWDILHLNSIMKFPDGDYLLSARHTDAIYKISHNDGSIVWRLGGVKNDFLRQGWNFSRQHHARVLEQNSTHTVISMFDNAIGDGPFEKATSDRSRGLVIQLDTLAMKADIVAQYDNPNGQRTNARGSFQNLPNGNKFICWAYNSYLSEHASDGSLVMEARLPVSLTWYRAFKPTWVGAPSRPPDIHAEAVATGGDVLTIVHVSWNGDTRTAKWHFHEVDEQGNAQRLGSSTRSGFESRYEHRRKTPAREVYAEAFDADGNVLGRSATITPASVSRFTNDGATPKPQPSPQAVPEQESSPGDEDSSTLSESWFHKPIVTFNLGVICSFSAIALAWICVRLYRKHWREVRQSKDEARYMPLEDLPAFMTEQRQHLLTDSLVAAPCSRHGC